MIKMQVTIKNGDEVDLNVLPVTQLIGGNGEKKLSIIEGIYDYFSRHRVKGDDEFAEKPLIIIDGQLAPRGMYDIKRIKHVDDIENQLSSNKSSMLYEYISQLIEKFDIAHSIYQLNDHIEYLVSEFNRNIDIQSVNVAMSSIDYGLKELLKNNIKVEINEGDTSNFKNINNIRKFSAFLELIEIINNNHPKRRLIILENIDLFISASEYDGFITKCQNISSNSDISFIITTCKDGYVRIEGELIQGVNVINNIVFNVPNFEILCNYVNNHYPFYRDFDEEEISNLLLPILQNIGQRNTITSISSLVIYKLLNISEDIEFESIEKLNKLELEYIQN